MSMSTTSPKLRSLTRRKASRSAYLRSFSVSTASSPFISVRVPSSAFVRMDQELISRPPFKDSFGYYATRAPSRRCPCRHRRQPQASSAQPRASSFAVLLPLARQTTRREPGRTPSRARPSTEGTRSARRRSLPGAPPWSTPLSSPSAPSERSQRVSPQPAYRLAWR